MGWDNGGPRRGKSKDRTHETTCINNLHQIGVGMRLYQDDNQTRFPANHVEIRDPTTGKVTGTKEVRHTLGGRAQESTDHDVRIYPLPNERPLNRSEAGGTERGVHAASMHDSPTGLGTFPKP